MATAYYAIPKPLFTDPRFINLSIEAKTLYGFMRDRLKLSLKNDGWQDTIGTYILMARKTMAEFLRKSLPTVRKIVAELIGAGLLREKRMGLTKCNRIYVQLLPGETANDFQPGIETNDISAKKADFSLERKPVASNNGNSKEINKRGYERHQKNEKSTEQRRGGGSQTRSKYQSTVPAQQYEQREYSREYLYSLFEVI